MATYQPLYHFYVRESYLPFEEDETHEFKGHRNISVEDIPHWVFDNAGQGKRTRKCVSRNLNAFLNSGRGGTVYCGVSDKGRVLGMHLTRYQKDHVLLAVRDTLQRYQPPVPRRRYRVRFVPVVERGETHLPPPTEFRYDVRLREKQHRVATSDYCWCDADAKARSQAGQIPLEYVIEMEIMPWDGAADTLHPFYVSELGKCYIRRQASIRPLSALDCVQVTRQEAAAVRSRLLQQARADCSFAAAQLSAHQRLKLGANADSQQLCRCRQAVRTATDGSDDGQQSCPDESAPDSSSSGESNDSCESSASSSFRVLCAGAISSSASEELSGLHRSPRSTLSLSEDRPGAGRSMSEVSLQDVGSSTGSGGPLEDGVKLEGSEEEGQVLSDAPLITAGSFEEVDMCLMDAPAGEVHLDRSGFSSDALLVNDEDFQFVESSVDVPLCIVVEEDEVQEGSDMFIIEPEDEECVRDVPLVCSANEEACSATIMVDECENVSNCYVEPLVPLVGVSEPESPLWLSTTSGKSFTGDGENQEASELPFSRVDSTPSPAETTQMSAPADSSYCGIATVSTSVDDGDQRPLISTAAVPVTARSILAARYRLLMLPGGATYQSSTGDIDVAAIVTPSRVAVTSGEDSGLEESLDSSISSPSGRKAVAAGFDDDW